MARYRSNLKFWPSLIMLLILALSLQLSSWQWHRYHQKLQLQNTYRDALGATEIPLSLALMRIQQDALVFTPVTLTGHYDAQHSIVLDNRSHQGQAGYEIFTPFIQKSAPAILIDRGFVPIGKHWQDLPDLSVSVATVTLNGFLTKPQANFTLGPIIEPTPSLWPLRVVRIDTATVQKHYATPLLPYVILLKADQAGSYVCESSYPQLFAERSLGYTFQWLALALATLVLWIIISFKWKPN